VPRRDTPSLVEGLEAVGQQLTEEEIYQVELWEKGKALSQIVGHYGWDVILATLKNYEDDSTERLKRIDPSKTAEVLAEHAVMYAAGRIYANFVEDVQAAVEASQKPPAALKRGMSKLRPGPVESLG
jgi:hypothetical protein